MPAVRWTRRSLDAILMVALAAVALTAGIALLAPATGGRTLVIGGGSMEPTIPVGSLILAMPADRYAVGDVVAVEQPGATPYTHRIVRFAELDGEPFIETKGDANAAADPAIVPVRTIVGRVAVAFPLLGYLGVLLGSAAGLAGFLALGGSLLLASTALEDWERAASCAACADAPFDHALPPPAAAAASAAIAAAATSVAAGGAARSIAPPMMGRAPRVVPREPAHLRVRESRQARHPGLPVLLERDRRNPRRHGRVSTPAVPALPAAAAWPATGRAA
jgi:signal peptidase